MSFLSCPICQTELTEQESCFQCANRHSFDIAKEGYVNLLVGEKGQHGDNKLMLQARRLFLENGFYSDLKDTVCHALCEYSSPDAVLVDEGCGEGYYTEGMAKVLPAARVFGFDISREAVRLAAKRKCGSFFVGSTYKVPLQDACADTVTLLFSPFCREEILRILKKNGIFIMAVPSADHLFELKEVLYEKPYRNQVQDSKIDGFTLLAYRHTHNTITLNSKEEIAALFSMTPYYYKTPRQGHEKLEKLERLTTTTSFEVFVYRKNENA